jgi:predicted ATPase
MVIMASKIFREKVRNYCRLVGKLQKELSQELGLNYSVLSNKLNGTSNARLTQPEIKQIIRTMAKWGALSQRSEAVELLELSGLKASSFTDQEWQTEPLLSLEGSSISATIIPINTARGTKMVKEGGTLDSPPKLVVMSENGSTSTLLNNVPVALTPLVGRTKELGLLQQHLQQPDCRLMTLTGPGGVGKTRLSKQLAYEISKQFSAGVVFVSLAPVTDTSLVATVIARELALKENSKQTLLENLKDFLRNKQLLLVLDNFEQITGAASLLDELLNTAPALKIIVTSRISLHLSCEQVFEVTPLDLPDLNYLANQPEIELPSHIAQNYAVRLFVERARTVKANFALSPENAQTVAEICVTLNGLPLAIELATSHLKVFSPRTLLARLHANQLNNVYQSPLLEILKGGSQSLPFRQQTLRHTLDWSYDLLEAEEKKLFHRLAIFSGGWTLEAAEAICNLEVIVPDLPSEPIALVDCLEALIDKSIVRSEEDAIGELRFSMLQMIKEYALEKLIDSGEEVALRRLHAQYFLKLAQTAEPELRGSQQVRWAACLEIEHNNMRSALTWLLGLGANEPGSTEIAAQLAVALYRFWWLRSHFSEGRYWLESVLLQQHNISKPLQAQLLHGLGQILWDQGARDDVVPLYEKSLAIFRELDDKAGVAGVLDGLGYAVSSHLNDFERALALHHEALALCQALGNRRGVAVSLYNQGLVEQQRADYNAAKVLFEQSLQAFLELSDTWGIEISLTRLINLVEKVPDSIRAKALYQQNFDLAQKYGDVKGMALSLRGMARLTGNQGLHREAIRLFEDSLTLFHQLGDKRGMAHVYYGLGWENLLCGNYEQATSFFKETLEFYRTSNDILANLSLVGLAILASKQNQHWLAAQLFGFTSNLFEKDNSALLPNLHSTCEEALAITRQKLSQNSFEQAWCEGLQFSLEQAFDTFHAFHLAAVELAM